MPRSKPKTQRDEFLQAIYANPDDDELRLVFADWLEEQGEAGWAELIRLQIEQARFTASGSDSAVLWEMASSTIDAGWDGVEEECASASRRNARILALIGRHYYYKGGRKFGLPANCGLRWDLPERGFFNGGELVRPEMLATRFAAQQGALPVESLSISQLRRDQIRPLIEAGVFAKLRRLEISGDESDEVFELLSEVPDVAGIRSLNLRFPRRLPDGQSPGLAMSAHWSGLRDLTLTGFSTGFFNGLTSLMTAETFQNLTSLHFTGKGSAEEILALRARGNLPRLRNLQLRCSPFDSISHRLSIDPIAYRSLKRFCMTSWLFPEGLTELFLQPELVSLAVTADPFDGREVAAPLDADRLARAPQGAMRALVLSGPIGVQNLHALSAWSGASQLTFLGLDNVSSEGVEALFQSRSFTNLKGLSLSQNSLTPQLVEQLADWPSFRQLHSLALEERVHHEGIPDVLMRRPEFKNLREILLEGGRVPEKDYARLRRRLGKVFRCYYPRWIAANAPWK